MKVEIALVVLLALVGGCGKRDEPQPVAPVSSMKQNIPESPALPTPPLPKVSADANPVTGPAPGQANDHSSPAFKDGGVPEKKK